MAEKWTVLGGWATVPELLRPLFGNGARYVDINPLMPDLIDDGMLRSDWRSRCIQLLSLDRDRRHLLAGWSTGAMLACGCAAGLGADALVCISATPSFCRSSAFSHGTRPSILRTMRKELSSDPEAVVRNFRIRCGLHDTDPVTVRWTAEELLYGLIFLEQLSLFDISGLSCPVLSVHGTADRIIPHSAGKYLCRQLDGTFLSINAPHACFIGHSDTIRSKISTILKGITDEPF